MCCSQEIQGRSLFHYQLFRTKGKTGTEMRINKSHCSHACLSQLLATRQCWGGKHSTRFKYFATLVMFLPFCICSFPGLLMNTKAPLFFSVLSTHIRTQKGCWSLAIFAFCTGVRDTCSVRTPQEKYYLWNLFFNLRFILFRPVKNRLQ